MEGYDDFNMIRSGAAAPAAEICCARGVNAEVPPQWLIYIVVEDLEASIARCEALGGKVIQRCPEGVCIIQDPAGAVAALYKPA